jgi:hypothetical protein
MTERELLDAARDWPALLSSADHGLVRCRTPRAFREWANRHHVARCSRGRCVLYDKTSVLAALTSGTHNTRFRACQHARNLRHVI